MSTDIEEVNQREFVILISFSVFVKIDVVHFFGEISNTDNSMAYIGGFSELDSFGKMEKVF
jgi:hypothetical protein